MYTFADRQRFSKSVYRNQLGDRLDKVMDAALLLERQLAELQNSGGDPVTSLAKEALSDVLEISNSLDTASGESELAEFRAIVGLLVSEIRLAKHFAAHWVSATRGRPKGAGQSGVAMNKLIARLEFAARAAGGSWTLNKNEESGTLISALEVLRKYLPDRFVPAPKKHPYSSYQRVLTRARSEWNSSRLPSEMLNDHPAR